MSEAEVAVDTDIMASDNAPALTAADTDVLTDGDKDTGDVKVIDDDKAGEAGDADTSEDSGKTDTDKDEPGTAEPASYELPEGIELSADETKIVDEMLSKYSLNSEQAQGIIDFMIDQANAGESDQEESRNQMLTDWANECRNDKEFGGDNFGVSQSAAKAAIDAFGGPEMKAMLNETGMKANPELFRFMVKVGKTLKEDDPGSTGGQSHTEKSVVDRMYPNDENNKKT